MKLFYIFFISAFIFISCGGNRVEDAGGGVSTRVTTTFKYADIPGDDASVNIGSETIYMIYAKATDGKTLIAASNDSSFLTENKNFRDETEVTHELWYIVYRWATGEKNMNHFIDAGEMGQDNLNDTNHHF